MFENSVGAFIFVPSVGCLAQLVEQLTLNQRVEGSIPSVPTTSEYGPLRGFRDEI
jgi:hypothetical protein